MNDPHQPDAPAGFIRDVRQHGNDTRSPRDTRLPGPVHGSVVALRVPLADRNGDDIVTNPTTRERRELDALCAESGLDRNHVAEDRPPLGR